MMVGPNKLASLNTQSITSTHESQYASNSVNGKIESENGSSSLKIHMQTSGNGPVLRNEIKIPINKEEFKSSKPSELFITNVTVTKPPISPSRSSSKEMHTATSSNDRFVTESSEMVTYKDGEVVEKKIFEKYAYF